MFAGKCVKWEKILIVFREHTIFNIKWAEVHKKSEAFWVKPFWKMSDLFCYFLLALRLSARKSEIKKKLRWCPLERTLNERYVRNNIFKKRIPDMSFWIIYNLVQISFFVRLLKYFLASVFFFIFSHFFPKSFLWLCFSNSFFSHKFSFLQVCYNQVSLEQQIVMPFHY